MRVALALLPLLAVGCTSGPNIVPIGGGAPQGHLEGMTCVELEEELGKTEAAERVLSSRSGSTRELEVVRKYLADIEKQLDEKCRF